ncbi:MAG TPA: Yip1 family protein [Thermoanaerobaculia bacterium]|jgi:hypothetical protein|nr:Yip1 family protein [Thermoanaerobaculia bacterium]
MRNLLAILYRPAETMRSILAQPRDRMVLPLVLLAGISDALRSVSTDDLRHAPMSPHILAIVIGVCLAVLLVAVLLFYGMAWVVTMVGRLFDGQGTSRAMRSALAWGLVPVVLSLLYRIPLAFAPKPPGMVAVIVIVQAAIFLWWIGLTSFTVAEAHQFSAWTGLGTIALSSLAPLVVVGAGVLTMMMKR